MMKFNFDSENKVLEVSHQIKNDLFVPIDIVGSSNKEDALRKWTFIQIYKPGTTRKFSLPALDTKDVVINNVTV